MTESPEQVVRDAIAELQAVKQELAGDPEACHGEADEILLKTLRRLGAAEVADAFNRIQREVGFWYA